MRVPRHTLGMTSEATDAIDPRNNPESRATESSAEVPLSRAGGGSVVPSDQLSDGDAEALAAPPVDQDEPGGTAEGDPLAGVGISQEDLDGAVKGKAGPEPTSLGQN